jgi:hypothetical protein
MANYYEKQTQEATDDREKNGIMAGLPRLT